MPNRQAKTRSGDPLVSVILPCYREPVSVVGRALDSVFGQTYRHLEVIAVLDDPGNAELSAFLDERAGHDARLKVIRNEVNVGPWLSYNRGVVAASGSIIAIQDDDDVSYPGRIETLTRFLVEHPDVGVVGSAVAYIDEASGRTILTRIYPPELSQAIRRYSPLAHPATVRRADLFRVHGLYDGSPEYRHAADYELWCRWFVNGVRMANVPQVLYGYYQSPRNFKARNVRAILHDTVRIKRRYARRLHFGVVDYLWLAIEAAATVLPAQAIVAGFYVVNRWRSRR